MTCYYIDDYHLEASSDHGRNLYHICEFAEQMETNECLSIIPLRKSLPDYCFSFLESTGEIIRIDKGERGYTPTGKFAESGTPRDGVDALNSTIGVTRAQESAMVAGSMFGWNKPAADPARYGDDGLPLTKKQRESGDAR